MSKNQCCSSQNIFPMLLTEPECPTAFLMKVQHESLRKGQVAKEVCKPSAADIALHGLT